MNFPAPPQAQHLYGSIPTRISLMHHCPMLKRLSSLIADLNQAEPAQRERIAQELAEVLKSATRLHTNLPEELLDMASRPLPY